VVDADFEEVDESSGEGTNVLVAVGSSVPVALLLGLEDKLMEADTESVADGNPLGDTGCVDVAVHDGDAQAEGVGDTDCNEEGGRSDSAMAGAWQQALTGPCPACMRSLQLTSFRPGGVPSTSTQFSAGTRAPKSFGSPVLHNAAPVVTNHAARSPLP